MIGGFKMDNDLITLIKILNKKSYLTLKDLEIATKATKRQVTYRLNKINNLLKSEGLPMISTSGKKELLIENNTREFLVGFIHEMKKDDIYYLNKKERLAYIYLMLFMNPDYIALQHFIDALQVSRSTVLLDFKDLVLELDQDHITIKNNRIHGYYLSGSEMEIRRYMMKLIISSLADERNTKVFDLFIDDFNLDTYEYSKLVITELSERYHISFVEDRLVEFIYIFIFLKARMISGKDASAEISMMPDLDVMKSMKEYAFTEALLTNYKNTSAIPEKEVNYISSWILGISVGNVEEDTQDCLIIGEIIGKIMTRFEFLSGIHYKDSEEIFRQLFSHFRPAYYRLLFKLPIFNPLCQRVKEEYKELYALVKETMKPFTVLFGEDIPEDELAYLTIHFATIYSKNREGEAMEKKRALIVCSNGIGSSAILYNELKSMFPELHFYLPIEAAGYTDFKEPVEIIFTTQFHKEMRELSVPVVKVSPVMDMRERYDVVREVCSQLKMSLVNQPNVDMILEAVRKHAVIQDENALYNELYAMFSPNENAGKDELKGYKLTDLISKNLVCLNLDAKDWEDAIRQSGAPLVVSGKVTQHYIDEIIRINKATAPYIVITKHVALPHTRPENGALKCALGVATLKEPVVFGSAENDPVKYIFCLSALDNESHLPAMSQFLELINNEEFFTMLDHAENADEVMAYIEKFEAEAE